MGQFFQIWDKSVLDFHNDRAINFEPGPAPIIRSIRKYFSILDHLSIEEFLHTSTESRLRIQFARLKKSDREKCELVHHLSFFYLGKFFEHNSKGSFSSVPKADVFHMKDCGKGLLFNDWEDFIRDYLDLCKSPIVRSRCQLALLLLGRRKGRTRAFIASVYRDVWQEARHFLRFSDFQLQWRGLEAFSAACYILCSFRSAIDDISELEQTIKWLCHEGSLPNAILKPIGDLILLFSQNDQLRVKPEVAGQLCRHLNEKVVNCALRSNTNWLQHLSDLSYKIAIAYGESSQAQRLKDKVDTLVALLGKQVGGPVGLKILEDLIVANPQGIVALSRQEFVKLKRETNRHLLQSMKPLRSRSIEVDPQNSVVLSEMKKQLDILDKLDLVTHYPGLFPNQAEADCYLIEVAKSQPLIASIGVETLQGDRNSGGTHVDENFKTKEAILNHLFLPQFLQQVLPAIIELVTVEANRSELISLIKQSPGWSQESERQFDAALSNLVANKSIECLFVLIAYFEGYIRRSLDHFGVPIDQEYGTAANVIHAKLLETLIVKYSALAEWDEMETLLLRQVLHDESAGWNLRNNAYHGLLLDNQIDMTKCSIVFFFFLKVVSEVSRGTREKNRYANEE